MAMQTSAPTRPDSQEVMAYHLATARVDGTVAVVLVTDAGAYLLQDLLEGPVPAEAHQLLLSWQEWEPRVASAANGAASSDATPVQVDQWFAPVRPDKFVCIGANYHDHLKEMGTPPPALPYSFFKPVSTGIVGSGEDVALPAKSKMVDWEAELAVVIGSTPDGDGSIMDCIAGYTVLNDLSARDWIIDKPAVGIDWVMMKAYDGFSPIGPFFTPRDFVADPNDLWIRCWVNDELKQDSNTSEMVFDVEAILTHLASIMTLMPGDVIATGTPAGVGFGAHPQQFLHHGDTVAVEIEGLGRLETRMVDLFKGAPA